MAWIYLTASMTKDQTIQFRNDIYAQDEQLLEATAEEAAFFNRRAHHPADHAHLARSAAGRRVDKPPRTGEYDLNTEATGLCACDDLFRSANPVDLLITESHRQMLNAPKSAEQSFADGKILRSATDGVGVITFDDTQKRNAMSLDMWEGLGQALVELRDDPGVPW